MPLGGVLLPVAVAGKALTRGDGLVDPPEGGLGDDGLVDQEAVALVVDGVDVLGLVVAVAEHVR